jgi:GT2 family glycosyltransferase
LDDFSFKDILLVHNGSEKKHIEKLQEVFPDIEHLIMPVNQGFTGGANAGLQKAFEKNDWCLFLTNDCILERIGKLPQKPGLVCPLIVSRKTENVDSIGGLFDPIKGQLFHSKSEHQFYSSNLRKYAPGTAFFLHKSAWQQVGSFDTKLFTYWEDVDFSQRLQKFGFGISLDETWKVRHAIGKTCHKNPIYSLYYYQRNRRWISQKYCPQNQKFTLYFYLTKTYITLFFKLILRKRFQDLRLLNAAYFD